MASVGIVARIFQRKPVEMIHAETDHGELKRSLGALNLVLLLQTIGVTVSVQG